MKKPSGIYVIVLVLVFTGYFYWVKSQTRHKEAQNYSEEDHIEYFSLPDLDGQEVDLKEIVEQNEITWISFWASWCNPCRRLVPTMNKVYSRHKDQGLGMVLISVGEKRETVRGYLDDHPIAFPVLTDTAEIQAQRINIRELPTSFLVDSTGKVISRVGSGLFSLRYWPGDIYRRFN